MIIALITIGLIVGTAFLSENAKNKNSTEGYTLVLLGGIITLLFEPIVITVFTDRSVDGGVIQMFSTVLGIYWIIWSIIRMTKKGKPTSNVRTKVKNIKKISIAESAEVKLKSKTIKKSAPDDLLISNANLFLGSLIVVGLVMGFIIWRGLNLNSIREDCGNKAYAESLKNEVKIGDFSQNNSSDSIAVDKTKTKDELYKSCLIGKGINE